METEKNDEHKRHEHSHHKEEHKKTTSKKLNLYNIFVGLTFLLGFIVIINIILTFNLSKDLKKSTAEEMEKLRPGKIELISIKNSKCNDCFDVTPVIRQIKSSNVNVTNEKTLEFNSKDGKEIISKYKIEKIPSVVVIGEIDKVNSQGLEKKEKALLIKNIGQPYTDVATGKIEGRVTLYVLKDTDCTKCNNMTALINQIKAAGVKIYEEKNIATNSNEGKELINKYGIDFVPTLLLSKEAVAYEVMQRAWSQVGTKEIDGSYVLRLVYPPFINLTTGKFMGLVNIIYLTDNSCTECYDVKLHKQIISSPQSFAISLDKEETIDISDVKGKELVAKYNITQVPATILSGEVDVYPASKALKQFFTAEKDGAYVFRRVNLLGTYKDLTTNQVVKAQESEDE